jgi:putative flippase GtrA
MNTENNNGKQLNQHSAEFMLREFERLHELRIDTTRQIEERVSFFLTIISAAVGGLIVLSQVPIVPPETLSAVTQGILGVLLAYGMNVLNRVITRDIRLRAILHLSKEVQDYFGCRDPEISSYVSVEREAFTHRKSRSRVVPILRRIFSGGLAQLVAFSNSLLCGGIVLTILSTRGYPFHFIVGWTTVTVLTSTILLYAYYFAIRALQS